MGNRTFFGPILALGFSIMTSSTVLALGLNDGGCSFADSSSTAGCAKNDPAQIVIPAQTVQPPKQQVPRAAPANSFAGKDCNSMEVSLSNLNYVAMNLSDRVNKSNGKCTVVSGSTDATAKQLCQGQGKYLINPGNPQYGEIGRGDLNSNNLNYYFCIQSSESFNKRAMCTEMQKSHPDLSIVFEQKQGSADGNCLCSLAGSKSMQQGNCTAADLAKLSAEAAAKEQQKPAEAAKAATNPNEPTANMLACMKKWDGIADVCQADSNSAKTSCDERDDSNDEVAKAQSTISKTANSFIKSNQGGGAITQCLTAGAIASTSKNVMGSMKNTCDDNYTACKVSCDVDAEAARSKMENDCKQYFSENKPAGGGESANEKYYAEHQAAIASKFVEGAKVCYQDATESRDALDKALAGLGDAAMAGLKCSCQFAAGLAGITSGSCASLPTAEQCLANPGLAGCAAVMALDICTQGSANYSAQGCACQTNPRGVGCADYVATAGGLSGFAGADIGTPSSSGTGSFAAGASGSGGGLGDIDISGNRASDLASGNKTPGALAGFAGGGGGGGGGGLGATPTSPGEGNAAAAGDGEGSGLTGAFGALKSMAGSLFGNKNNSTATSGRVGPDMSRFLPKGNRAVASEFGGKNMEIWHMMNNVYDDSASTFRSGP